MTISPEGRKRALNILIIMELGASSSVFNQRTLVNEEKTVEFIELSLKRNQERTERMVIIVPIHVFIHIF